jgi:NADPH:quinone reductase-like Zn-dependent oxidoreductase
MPAAIWDLADARRIRPRVHAELSLQNTLAGFAFLQERAVIGKVVIRCDQ